MAGDSEIRRELAGERKELADAVSSLREELARARDRGKKVSAAVGAAGSAVAAARILLKLRRR